MAGVTKGAKVRKTLTRRPVEVEASVQGFSASCSIVSNVPVTCPLCRRTVTGRHQCGIDMGGPELIVAAVSKVLTGGK